MDDVISRKAAIALADKLKDNLPDDERIADAVMAHNEGILEYQTALSLLPPASTPSRPIGYWMRMSDLNESENDRYQCSCCGNIVHHRDKVFLYTYNSWCGACGANMNVKNYVAYMQGGAI